jgi:hypothetical protein
LEHWKLYESSNFYQPGDKAAVRAVGKNNILYSLSPGTLTILIPAHAHGVAEHYTTGLARLKLVTRDNSDQTELQIQDELYLPLSRQGRFEPL